MESTITKLTAATLSLAIPDSNDSTSHTPPRPNFPLPAEIRDQVYGYLLHHQHTKTAPYHERDVTTRSEYSIKTNREKNTAHTYQYHPAILATNRQINQEAREVLASNHFVVVSIDWDGLEQAKHYHSVPIVCEEQKAVAKFKDHHLRVHVQHSFKQKRTQGIRSFLMLAVDLPVFCSEMLQWNFFNNDSLSGVLVTLPGLPPERLSVISPNVNNRKPVPHMNIKIQLRSITAKPLGAALETRLLRPFQDLTIGPQRVSITGCLQPDKTKAYALFMGAQTRFLKPTAWKALELTQTLKCRGDELVKLGDLTHAVDRYHLVAQLHQSCRLLDLPQTCFQSDVELPVGRMQYTAVDAIATVGFIHLRLGNVDDACSVLSELPYIYGFLRKLPSRDLLMPTDRQKLPCWQAVSWLNALTLFLTDRHSGHHGGNILGLVDDLRELDESSEHAKRLAHDLYLMHNTLTDAHIREEYLSGAIPQLDLVKASSVHFFAPLIFDMPPPVGLSKPEGMRGFFDCHDYKSYVAANPGLGLMSPEELDRMFENLGC
ncbi:hypothetical protein LTR36_001256 [Oleoguttula mirabilis]|uniref:Uncharacterized protein n=1 Tax=Oleoguttula mirabilis TaxID=1507867 RepID=A0AAV9JPC3_9PEZI|nr:hypothetical protein LTR36_001256 [Oleoguttula mirabilis]